MAPNGMLGQGVLVDVAALAAISLIGYLFGRRTRGAATVESSDHLQDELAKAQQIADELRCTTLNVSVELGAHARSVAAFQRRLGAMQAGAAESDWPKLRETADMLLGATLKLATNMTMACAQMRAGQTRLTAFSASRVDPATRLHNRRSLEEQLEAFFSIHSVGKRKFSLAMFSVSGAGTDEAEQGELRLRQIARQLEACIRDDDFVARYSQDEFVVLMPQTPLAGALAFSERLLIRASAVLNCPVWGGVMQPCTALGPRAGPRYLCIPVPAYGGTSWIWRPSTRFRPPPKRWPSWPIIEPSGGGPAGGGTDGKARAAGPALTPFSPTT
jgi:GGDEF domain-containing protein